MIVRIGSVVIHSAVLANDVQVRPPGVHEVDVFLSVPALLETPVDYAADSSIQIDDGCRAESGFHGFVEQVQVEGDVLRISLVSGLRQLADTEMGGVEFQSMGTLEAAWSLMRAGGVDEHRILLDGFRKGPNESFLVAVPLDGMYIDPDLTLHAGSVLFTRAPDVQALADSFTYAHLKERHRSAQLWAISEIEAGTAFDAEVAALDRIDRALEWLTLRMHYSYSFLPNGQALTYERGYLRARYSRRDVIIVLGRLTGRRWIRDPEDQMIWSSMRFDEHRNAELPRFPTDLTLNLREAIHFWNRANQASDPLDKIVLLTNAMEFYATGSKPPRTFSRRDRRGIERRVNESLSETERSWTEQAFADGSTDLSKEQRDRLYHVVRRILDEVNEPSFLMRLSYALHESEVPVSDAEWKVLENVREVRNRLVHGNEVAVPNASLLREASALVNRMVMYRLYRG